jgi:hypothetical protein
MIDISQAGYGRHRTTYLRNGLEALEDELDMDCTRLWERNLGRYKLIIYNQLEKLDELIIWKSICW